MENYAEIMKISNEQGDMTSPFPHQQGDLTVTKEKMSPTSPCLVSPGPLFNYQNL